VVAALRITANFRLQQKKYFTVFKLYQITCLFHDLLSIHLKMFRPFWSILTRFILFLNTGSQVTQRSFLSRFVRLWGNRYELYQVRYAYARSCLLSWSIRTLRSALKTSSRVSLCFKYRNNFRRLGLCLESTSNQSCCCRKRRTVQIVCLTCTCYLSVVHQNCARLKFSWTHVQWPQWTQNLHNKEFIMTLRGFKDTHI